MGVVLKGCWRVDRDRWGDRARAVVDWARKKARERERVGCIVEAVVALLNTEFGDVRGSSRLDCRAPFMLSVPQGR